MWRNKKKALALILIPAQQKNKEGKKEATLLKVKCQGESQITWKGVKEPYVVVAHAFKSSTPVVEADSLRV